MRVRYQRGHLRCVKRKDGPLVEFLWRENDLLERVSDIIPSSALWNSIRLEDLAQAAVSGLDAS